MFSWLFQLDDEPNLYIKKWLFKSPFPSIQKWWPLGFQVNIPVPWILLDRIGIHLRFGCHDFNRRVRVDDQHRRIFVECWRNWSGHKCLRFVCFFGVGGWRVPYGSVCFCGVYILYICLYLTFFEYKRVQAFLKYTVHERLEREDGKSTNRTTNWMIVFRLAGCCGGVFPFSPRTMRATNINSRANSSYPSFFPDVLMKHISCIYPPPPGDSRKRRFTGIPY